MTFDANWKKELLFVVAFLVLLFCLQIATLLNAQVAGQTLSGRITSAGGASIANARVTLKNPANGDTKSIAATEDGSFTFANIAPGVFEIAVSAPGFADARTTGRDWMRFMQSSLLSLAGERENLESHLRFPGGAFRARSVLCYRNAPRRCGEQDARL